eukprot:gene10350-biopygen1759
MMSIPGGWNSAGRAQNCAQMTGKTVRVQACAVAQQAGCLYTLPSVAVLQAQCAAERIWPTVQCVCPVRPWRTRLSTVACVKQIQ